MEFASQSARRLMKRHLGVDNGRLPLGLLGRSRLVVADDERRLTIRVFRTGTLRILLLEERDIRLERLTDRERGVLERVTRGQTNVQMASELGIANPTVAKHLEHIYGKLDVGNRTAAAALLDSWTIVDNRHAAA